MKNQPFFLKLKKILAYPFNWKFISLQQKVVELLNEECNNYYKLMREKRFDENDWAAHQVTVNLRNEINKCWNLHDVTQLLKFKINQTFEVAGWLNIPIYDKKTGWFLWKNIFEWANRIGDSNKKTLALCLLSLLQEISTIYDLGK